MSDLHPNFFLSKRFPVHAAIELRDMKTLKELLSDQIDANFYFERQLPHSEVSVLHQACCVQVSFKEDQEILDMVRLCILKGAEVNSVDCVGQTPLFYAVTHIRARELTRLLLDSGLRIVDKPKSEVPSQCQRHRTIWSLSGSDWSSW